jgi:hypothetical protein
LTRSILGGVAAVAAGLAAVLLALWFFTARDDATTSGPPPAVPGVAATVPARYAADVSRGNVVIATGDAAQRVQARRLASEIAGAPSAALRAAGQAVIVDEANPGPRGELVAWAQDRRLAAPSADDPHLLAFVEYWLGRAAG